MLWILTNKAIFRLESLASKSTNLVTFRQQRRAVLCDLIISVVMGEQWCLIRGLAMSINSKKHAESYGDREHKQRDADQPSSSEAHDERECGLVGRVERNEWKESNALC